MGPYIIRRFLQSLIVVLLVTIMIFFGMRMLPGDPIYMLISPSELQSLTPQQMAKIRHDAGIDRPLISQYVSWLGGVFQGELGQSILTKTSASQEIARRIPVTAYLGFLAFVFGILIGVTLGVISAVKRATWIDTIVTVCANLGITVPIFWLGIMMILLFAVQLKWLPTMGYTSPFTNFAQSSKQAIMPVICLAIFPIASNARQARSSLLEILHQDYIRTAWSKGLSERVVILKHALRNGLIPIVTLAGMGIPSIIGGSVLVEQVFNIPGMGRMAVNALFQRDYPYVQAVTLVITGAVVLSNLLVDLSYGWLDPRIRYN
jgi:peptide/nickel transport system permease protein